ncbi:MAG: T9SS type A sorting domain-containing protein [Ginsengibacter sp.]
MKLPIIKTFTIICALCVATLISKAQSTETFETQTPYLNSFNSNGQPFLLTNAFAVYSSRHGIGYDGSNRFIDNINSTVRNQLNSIRTTDGMPFSVQNFWLFTSIDGGNNPSPNGSILITGKMDGVVVFTLTKSTGFNSSYGTNHGFAYVDLATEDGVNNSNFTINEISFQLQGNFNYMALDNFTWTPAIILPVTVISFSGNYHSGKVDLHWKTSCESNSSHFLIERSSDGIKYNTIDQIKGAGYCNTLTSYSTVDENPNQGNNFYRLVAVDFDGKRKNHGIILIKNQANNFTTDIYPNPAGGNSINVKGNQNLVGKLYTIVDMNGRILQNGIISGSSQSINISSFSRGNYILRLSDGQAIQWIKK